MRDRTYFASDMHFGAPSPEASRDRERRFVAWLRSILPHAEALFLVGDVFDFWFEYRRAVPRGHLRLQGALAELADAGVQIRLFTGNHDLWYGDYFTRELGASIHREPYVATLHGHRVYVHHGDGLGPGEPGYKALKRAFTHPLPQRVFGALHPNWGIGLAESLSRLSANYSRKKAPVFYGEQEFLFRHAQAVLAQQPGLRYFIFGHRHLYGLHPLAPGAEVCYLGDWISHDSFAMLSDTGLTLSRLQP